MQLYPSPTDSSPVTYDGLTALVAPVGGLTAAPNGAEAEAWPSVTVRTGQCLRRRCQGYLLGVPDGRNDARITK